MSSNELTQRGFLTQASAAAAAVGLTARAARGTPGANDRISIGIIGLGVRGNAHIGLIQSAIKAKQNVAIRALCDVWQPNLNAAVERVKKMSGETPETYTRYTDMLADKDIDAITIATPDFSHGTILVAALKAGKDVYAEKPMTIQLSYANEALDLARKNGRVVQCGTQYRSSPILRGVAREVAAGTLGKISRVTSAASFNAARWKKDVGDCKAADVDWDAFLLNLPNRPFDASLLREWQLHRETSNGMAGLWMTHYVDALHMMLDLGYPVSAVAMGGNYVWKDGRENADTFHAVIEYSEGLLFDWGMSLGTGADWRFNICGRNGAIECQGGSLSSTKWLLSGKGAEDPKKIKERLIETEPTSDHMVNFLECIRTREKPRADIQYGHQHAVASILAATAETTGRRHRYDAAKREIVAL